jgi:hypothetical protein
MKIQEIKEILKTRKGQNLSVIIEKPLKTRKGISDVITKRTACVIRGGIEYDNITETKERREDGRLPEENAGLTWGEWAEFPFHLKHKGTDYARFYRASGINFVPKVEYFLNGELTTKETIQSLCLASEFPKAKPEGEENYCFTIKAENVKEIKA